VVLEIMAQNRPCDIIRVHHPTLVEEIAGKRGVSAIVLSIGTVRPGDACNITVNATEAD
jgi:MOSC domain-containing protein YiiM|tara:strand:+ start:135 stop:311 length:177 start_codon:yes stop_codon:yes gene_type:complete